MKPQPFTRISHRLLQKRTKDYSAMISKPTGVLYKLDGHMRESYKK